MVNNFSINSQKFFNCLVFLILVSALVLRIKIIATQSITEIEAFSLLEVIREPNLSDLDHRVASVPPIYYLILRFVSWFSTELFWLRMPNLLFFIVIFLIMFALVRKRGKLLTLLSLLLLSFSPYQLEYHWESYVYLLFQFWAAISFYVFYKLATEKLTHSQSTFWSIFLVISNLCGFFTHYSYFWFILTESVYVLFLLIREKIFARVVNIKYKALLPAILVTSVFLLFYLPAFASIYREALPFINWFDQLQFFDLGNFFMATFGVFDLIRYQYVTQIGIDSVALFFFLCFLLWNIWRFKKAKKTDLINDFGFFLALFSIVLVFVISKIINQSILVSRTLIPFSLFSIIYLAQLINFGLRQRVMIKVLTYFFTLVLFFHYYKEDQFLGSKHFYPDQITLANLIEVANKEKISALLFVEPNTCAYPQKQDEMSHLPFNYYWYGYASSTKHPSYVRITEQNFDTFYQRQSYWLLAIGCNREAMQHVSNQCSSVGQEYFVQEDGALIECKNENSENH